MNDAVAHSFLLLCGVLDLLVSIAKDGQVNPERLADLIVRHLEAYVAAFGGDEFFSKVSLFYPLAGVVQETWDSDFVLDTREEAQTAEDVGQQPVQCRSLVRRISP